MERKEKKKEKKEESKKVRLVEWATYNELKERREDEMRELAMKTKVNLKLKLVDVDKKVVYEILITL